MEPNGKANSPKHTREKHKTDKSEQKELHNMHKNNENEQIHREKDKDKDKFTHGT